MTPEERTETHQNQMERKRVKAANRAIEQLAHDLHYCNSQYRALFQKWIAASQGSDFVKER